MINDQLLEYIRDQREAGADDEDIKEKLRSAGWRQQDIEEGFAAVDGNESSPEAHQQVREEAIDERNQSTDDDDGQQPSRREASRGSGQQAQARDTGQQDGTQAGSYRDQSASQDSQRQQAHEQNQAQQTAGSQGQSPSSEPEAVRTMEEDVQRARSDSASSDATTSPADHDAADEADTQSQQSDDSKPQKVDETNHPQQKPAHQPNLKQSQTKEPNRTKQSDQAAEQTAGASTRQAGSQQQATTHRQSRQQSQKAERNMQMNTQPTRQTAQSSGKPDTGMKPKSGPDQKQEPQTQKTAQSPNQVASAGQGRAANATQRSGRQFSQSGDTEADSRIQQARRQSSSGASIATVILSLLGLLILGGGAAYAYVTFFQGPTANTSAQEVISSLKEAQTFQYRMVVSKQRADADSRENIFVMEGAVDTRPDTQAQTYYTITRPGQTGGPITGVAAEFATYNSLDPRRKKQIRKALSEQSFLSIREFQTKQKLGASGDSEGFTTNRFGATLDPRQLITMYSTVYESVFGNALNQETAAALRETVAGFSPQQGQIWTDPETNVPYQITVVGTGPDGQPMQVNMQFKNHGGDVSPPPETYSNRSIAAGLAESLDLTRLQEDTQSNTGDQQQDTAPPTTPGDTPPATTTTPDQQSTTSARARQRQAAARRQDQLRVNDIQQITIALQLYAQRDGRYPDALSSLTASTARIFSTVPRDPAGGSYAYAVNKDNQKYHLGATLKATSPSEVPADSDFNSQAAGFSSGFDGTGNTCQASQTQSGATCFDKTGTFSSQ